MTYYFKNGPLYRPTDESNVDIRTELPAGNYIIKVDQQGNMFFETVDGFTFNTKRYGSNPRHTRRILDTFIKRNNSTGVMLAGEKGSGKSLLAKTISMEAVKEGIPTIIINAPWCGEAFNALIQSIDQPAVILFDEFEKVYDSDQQEQILTLLDGVFPTKKLFVFTCNDKWRVDKHMRNRPGRIFYMLDFKGLEAGFIEEYCFDNLLNKTYIPAVCQLAALFSEFNFDMLKALIEEMNRYDETPTAALEMLNVRPEFDDGQPTYTVVMTRDGTVIKTHQKEYKGNPLTLSFRVYYHDASLVKKKKKKNLLVAAAMSPVLYEDEDDAPVEEVFNKEIVFTDDHLTSMEKGVYEFSYQGLTLTLSKKPDKKPVNWMDSFEFSS